MRNMGRFVAALLLAAAGTAAAASVVSGQVTNAQGAGIANVDIDFIDRDTGQDVPLTNDDTDILGFYAVTVAEGDYDVRFNPPAGSRYAAEEERGVKVEGPSQTLDMQLSTGFFYTGRVVDSAGVPQPNVDLDFIEALAGDVYVTDDNTKAGGTFQVVLKAGTYQVEFEPALGIDLAPKRLDGIVMNADRDEGDVVLADGFHLTGSVQDSLGAGLPAILVRTVDPFSGAEIFSIRNTTDTLGSYDFVVAAGDYTLELIPPRGARQLPRRVAGVRVAGATPLPPIPLDDGVWANGRVLNPSGDPAEGVDLDFVSTLSGHTAWTPRDNSDENGDYRIAVPAGNYDLRFDPPFVSGFAPTRLDAVDLSADLSVPTVQLSDGMDVSGVVVDVLAVPVASVDLDFLRVTDGVEMEASRDRTDTVGSFAARVAAGNYDVEFDPPASGGNGRHVEPGVAVSASVDLGTIVLPAASGSTTASVTPAAGSESGGTLVTIGGSGFAPGIDVRFGGVPAASVVFIDATTVQATTPPHRAGLVTVETINVGAAADPLPAAFTFQAAASVPQLTLDKTGPLVTDVTLSWTATGQTSYTLYRATSASGVTQSEAHDVVSATSYRDEGAAGTGSPDRLFYLVQ